MIPLAVYTESENESHSCPLRVIAISQRLADTMAWPTRWLGQHDGLGLGQHDGLGLGQHDGLANTM